MFFVTCIYRTSSAPWETRRQKVPAERNQSKQLCLKESQMEQHTEFLLWFTWGTATPSLPLQRNELHPLTMMPNTLWWEGEHWKTMVLFRLSPSAVTSIMLSCWMLITKMYFWLLFLKISFSGLLARSCQWRASLTTGLWIPALCMKRTAKHCFCFSSASAETPQSLDRNSQVRTRPAFATSPALMTDKPGTKWKT